MLYEYVGLLSTDLAHHDAVVLDVREMKCAGCSSAVKRILAANPLVEQAAVNLLTESAVITLKPNADFEAAGIEAAQQLTAKVWTPRHPQAQLL